ncbi:MAG: hypothetical protein ASUL_09569 [Candidatus Aramenus sulfurataquae]|uniref:Uncharacterized protein n=1 Tax=Candidatus Aramenus sulfurataquae TaxID=1326980 RepID=W7KV12_9CREN|nr:MAG: hypothetical protein ASUL_09569 [Candidatus Aramenus sulfurataquae]
MTKEEEFVKSLPWSFEDYIKEKEEDGKYIIRGNGREITLNLKNANYVDKADGITPEIVYTNYEKDKGSCYPPDVAIKIPNKGPEMCVNLIRVVYEDSVVVVKVCGDGKNYEIRVLDEGFIVHCIPLK